MAWTRTEMDDGVAVVTMVNEKGFNSFDPGIIRHIREELERLLADPSVRAIVLTGTGKAFSTGADVKAMAAAAQTGEAAAWVLAATAELHPLLLQIHASATPVIAAVNGVAAGGGLGLALAADARIGSKDARFAAGYFGIGLSPDGGATWLLPRLIGMQRTRRFFFDNEVMAADEARATGLLDELVDDPLARSIALAKRWGARAAMSRESTKRLLAAASAASFAHQLDMERGLIAAAAATPDFQEGTAAFVAKRAPRFA